MYKIIIADPSVLIRKRLVDVLKEVGFTDDHILQASNGEELNKVIKENSRIGMILMDWNLKDCEGIQVIKALKKKGISIPFMFVTYEARRQNIISAIQAGAVQYILKPFNPNDIKKRVSRLVHNKRHKNLNEMWVAARKEKYEAMGGTLDKNKKAEEENNVLLQSRKKEKMEEELLEETKAVLEVNEDDEEEKRRLLKGKGQVVNLNEGRIVLDQ